MTDGTSENSKPTMDSSEPSMEDILASIRQLIANDDDISGAGAAAETMDVNDDAPLELDVPLVLDSSLDEVIEESLAIPSIEIEAAELTPDSPSLGGLDIAVDAGAESDSGITAKSAADDDMILNDLMGDIISDETSVEVPVDSVVADLEVSNLTAQDLTPGSSDDPLEALLDIAADDAPPIDNDTQAISTEIDSDGFTKTDDVELGQDFDELMESFMADDVPETDDAASAEALSLDSGIADHSPEDEDIIPAADEFNLDGLIGDIMGPNSAEALDMAEVPNSDPAAATMIDSPIVEGAALEIEKNDIDASIEANDDFDLDSLLGDDLREEAAAAQPDTVNLAGNDLPIDDLKAGNIDSEEINIDSILSGFDEDLTAGVDIAEDDQGVDAVPASENEISDDSEAVDPDIELVKSLMAELTDAPEMEVSNEAPVNETAPDASKEELTESEDDVLFDLLSETLASEETIQADIQSDITERVEAIMGAETPDSSLVELAETITSDAALAHPEPSGAAADHMTGVAVAGGSLLAAVMAQTNETKPSALEALMGDEGAELDLSDDIELQDDLTPSDMDELVAEIINEDSAAIVTQQDAGDADIDGVLSDMLADEPQGDHEEPAIKTEQNNAIETDSDLSLIEDLLAPEVPNMTEIDVPLDASAETLNIETDPSPKPSKVEIDDMAVKPARETILDEVTETAAASAFASLNQVVEEKTITAERGDRIGDLVTEALQPMLKEWLDANLKGIVERATRPFIDKQTLTIRAYHAG